MYFTEFSTWFQSKALEQLKQNIHQLNTLMDEQFQVYKLESRPSTNEIPLEYLEFQVEKCLSSFKTNFLSILQQTSLEKKFTIGVKNPIDKPINLSNSNSLMEKAKLSASSHIWHAFPQLAFLDIETDGTDIKTANILQIAIIKPIIDPDYSTLNCIKSWSKYTLPWEGYSQKDNKAYHINNIGDNQLKTALDIDEALMHVSFHLCNTVIVGYNVNQFDIPILKRHCIKHNELLLHKYSIDLYPAIWKNKKQKLEDAIKAYNLPNNTNPHNATADATCCMDLLNEIFERNELPNSEEDLLDLFNTPQNIRQHYGIQKIIDINPDHKDYSYLLYQTPASSLKRKLSQINT